MTGPWISGESLSPSRLNLHQGGATLPTGFSTDTLQGQSGLTVNVISDLSAQNVLAGQRLELGGAPSSLSGLASLRANSQQSDYLFFQDAAGIKSNFLLGLKTGDSNSSTVDGLNLYDASDNTMIVRFSSDSVRFYPPIVAPVFDTGGALASTYNAALFLRGSSKESQVQAAITAAAADGVRRVYVPASLYPYSAASISFSTSVQMVREGGDWSVYDVWAYGADPTGVNSASSAIQAAANNATTGSGADATTGSVYIPTGLYKLTATLTVPTKVRVVGPGRSSAVMRAATTFPTNTPLIQLGDGVTPAFGVRLENLTLDCNNITNSIGIYMTNTHEQSGLIGVVIIQFKKYGLQCAEDTFGTASVIVKYCEFYGIAGTATACMYFVGSTTSQFDVSSTTASGATDGILIDKGALIATAFHSENAVNAIRVRGNPGNARAFVLGAVGHGTITNVINIETSFTSSAVLIGIQANGATNAIFDQVTGRTLAFDVSWYFVAEGPTGSTGRYILSSDQDSGGIGTPSALAAGNNNDYVLTVSTGPAKLRTARLAGAGGGSTITGIANGVEGLEFRLINISAITVTLSHQDANSAIGNRLVSPTGASIVLGIDDVATVQYDATTARWRIVQVLT